MSLWYYRLIERLHHYWLATQRVNVRVLIGLAVLVGSQWVDDPIMRARLRDASMALVVYSLTRWLQGQGKPRIDASTGRELRNTTLNLTAQEAEDVRRRLR